MNEELLNIIKMNFPFSSILYDRIVALDNKSSFNKEDFKKFLLAVAYIRNGEIDPEKIRTDASRVDRINEGTLMSLYTKLSGTRPEWFDDIMPHGKDKEESKLKIYLSIDNSSIHHFAYLFILGCIESGYLDFDFKINKKESVTRTDSVVIYCDERTIGKYVEVIEEIIRQHQEIKFNKPHLLGIPYDEHISFGKDPSYSKKSYTQIICKDIINAQDRGISDEEIVRRIEAYKKTKEKEFKELVSYSLKNDSIRR